ncbi:hypothetical protein AHAS_Ahas18G0065100 [Arachis hypogaea]
MVSGVPRLRYQVARPIVPRHAAQVARPWMCELFKLDVPRLGSQVARPSDFLELACHAFDTKWHAIVEVLLGMVSWHATPLCSSGTPLLCPPFGSLKFCISVPRPVSGVPRPHACLDFFSGL